MGVRFVKTAMNSKPTHPLAARLIASMEAAGGQPPHLVTLPWYSAAEYAQCVGFFQDPADRVVSYAEWKRRIEETLKALNHPLLQIVCVEIQKDAVTEWGLRRGLAHINKHAVETYCADVANGRYPGRTL